MKKTIASILLLMLMFSVFVFPTAAEESAEISLDQEADTAWKEKIDNGVWSIFDSMSENDYLEVHIELVELTTEEEDACLREVEEQTGWNVDKIKEDGEDRERFEAYVIAKLEEEQGLEPGSIDKDSYEAIHAISEEQRAIKRLLIRAKQAKRDANKDVFMSEHVNPIRPFDHYVNSTLIFEATKAEIIAMAKDDRCYFIIYVENKEVIPEDTSADESSNEDEPVVIMTGDVNADGTVNSLDAAQVLKYDAELIALEDEGLTASDVNGDGVVDSLDAAQILKFDAELITKF